MFNETQECEVGALKEERIDAFYIQRMVAPYNKTTLPTWEIALKIAFYLVAMLVDLVGNSIVILIVVLNRKMRTTTNTLICNLAISDLMVACFCMWAHVGNNITKNWPFGEIVCKVNTFFQILAVTSSVLTLMIIAVERFYAVVFPFKRNWSSTITGLVIVASWVVSLCTAFPQLIVRKEEVIRWQDRTDRWCEEAWPAYYVDTGCNSEAPGKIYYYIVVGLVMYFLPVLVMIFTYSIIACRLLRRRHPGRRPSGGRMSTQDRAKRKVTKMLVMVLFIFIVCWSPQQVIMMYDHLNPNKKSPDYLKSVRYIALYMAYACSAINPILYAGLNENFRRGFLEAFRCLLMQRRNRIDPDGSITRSRASTRRENAYPDRASVRQALEAKEMRGVANGLGVPDHTMAETMELSESPQDAEEQNQTQLHHDPGNGSLPGPAGPAGSLGCKSTTLDAASDGQPNTSGAPTFGPNGMRADAKPEQEGFTNQRLANSLPTCDAEAAVTPGEASVRNPRVFTESASSIEFENRTAETGSLDKSRVCDGSAPKACDLFDSVHDSMPVISGSDGNDPDNVKTFELTSRAPLSLSDNNPETKIGRGSQVRFSEDGKTMARPFEIASSELNTEYKSELSDSSSTEENSPFLEQFAVENSQGCGPLDVGNSDVVKNNSQPIKKEREDFDIELTQDTDLPSDALIGIGDSSQVPGKSFNPKPSIVTHFDDPTVENTFPDNGANSNITHTPFSFSAEHPSNRGGFPLYTQVAESDFCADTFSTDL